MSFKKNILKICLSVLIVSMICGCSSNENDKQSEIIKSENVDYDDNDYYSNYEDSKYTLVDLDELDGNYEISTKGTYVLSGKLNGSLVINSSGVVRIVLNNVEINSGDTSAIYVKDAKKCIISLPKGSKNTISDSGKYADEEITALIYSKDDLTFNGSGQLTLNANYKNAIQSKDVLKMMEGTYNITCANDAIKGKDALYIHDGKYTVNSSGDGIISNGTDSNQGLLVIEDGTFKITSSKDGIQSENDLTIYNGDFNIVSGGGSVNTVTTNENTQPMWGSGGDYSDSDAISTKGIKSNALLTIKNGKFEISSLDDALHAQNISLNNGTFNIKSDDDGIHSDNELKIKKATIDIIQSYEGIEGSVITVSSGNIKVKSSDDGINAASKTNASNSLDIKGGTLYINAEGDGLDSNGSITMSGGVVIVDGSASDGDGALDYDETFNISGGLLIASGGSGMAMTPSNTSSQNSLSINTSINANTSFYISDSEGNVICGYTAIKNYGNILISSPDIKSDSSYNIYTNGTIDLDDDYQVKSASGGSLLTTLDVTSVITTYGSGNMMGGGNPPMNNGFNGR